MLKTKMALEYREKYGKDMPTLKLARIMYAAENLTFTSVDDARAVLRYIEGKTSNGQGYRRTKKTDDRPKNPYKLPPSDIKDYLPFTIPESKLLILSDVHIPYHDIDAISAVMDYAESAEIEAILLNGDILDFHSLSRFVRDPKARSVAGELEALTVFYQALREHLPFPVYYKFGNHEERYDHFLYMKASELVGVEEFNLASVIERRMPGVQMIKDKRIIQFGSLNIIHGHEYASGIFQSVNVARGLFLKSKVSSLQGHAHQVSEHTETDMNGKITTTWSVGCLCDLHPDYAKLNKWSQGFAIAERDGDQFTVKNFRIHQGRIL